MPFQIIREDITRMEVDAIVNTASPSLLGGGGVDGAIHKAAGPRLKEACKALGGCKVGEVKVTLGFALPCRYVLHTVGPVWKGGFLGEEAALRRCYNNALETAESLQCESIAFPLISGGAFGYPLRKALHVATDCITAFVLEHELSVYLVLYGSDSLLEGRRLFPDLQEYIDDHYVDEKEKTFGFRRRRRYSYNRPEPEETAAFGQREGKDEDPGLFETSDSAWDHEYQGASFSGFSSGEDFTGFSQGAASAEPEASIRPDAAAFEDLDDTAFFSAFPEPAAPASHAKMPGKPPRESRPAYSQAVGAPTVPAADDAAYAPDDLDWLFEQIDESFQQMLLRKIDESGMTDAQCYKKANVDRKLFSKIRKDVQYRPSKPTAIAFAIALELSMRDTEDLLNKAGYALSRSSRFDLIIRYYIERGRYNIFEINEALFAYDQSLLGG